jgi:hypothetical protein
MQYTKQKVQIIILIAALLCSGLAISHNRLKANDVISYFASLYAPSQDSKKTTFSMSFGSETRSIDQMPKRSFVR